MQAQMSCRTPCGSAVRLSSSYSVRRGVAALSRPQLRMQSRRLAAPTVCVLDVTEESFEKEVLQSELPVLVDFWANWCGPCKLVAPSMVWAEKEYAGQLKVVKVEADGNKALIEKYKVYGLPALVIIKGGEEVADSHWEGAITRKALAAYLEKFGIAATAAAKA